MVLARRRPTENIHTSALLEDAEKAPREDDLCEPHYVVSNSELFFEDVGVNPSNRSALL